MIREQMKIIKIDEKKPDSYLMYHMKIYYLPKRII